MADLDALIRLRKHTVDEKQRVVAQLFREVEVLEKQKQTVQEQMAYEKKLAEDMGIPEAITFYGRYADGARKRIEMIQQSIKKLETRIETAQEEMRAAFAEMKKVQVTQDRRIKREKQEIQKKEDDQLSDIAIELFRRKSAENNN